MQNVVGEATGFKNGTGSYSAKLACQCEISTGLGETSVNTSPLTSRVWAVWPAVAVAFTCAHPICTAGARATAARRDSRPTPAGPGRAAPYKEEFPSGLITLPIHQRLIRSGETLPWPSEAFDLRSVAAAGDAAAVRGTTSTFDFSYLTPFAGQDRGYETGSGDSLNIVVALCGALSSSVSEWFSPRGRFVG
ncbi:hypothetical protein EVAR_48789_1 [Eumeta japonica]|uniref:Uncharacterized protein n=1 Tax=Eumeta variegata TaxID=151549 RepID=A0A4C1Y0H8_EUMVA|nr:hypothetical protein EVAR_48789_1 [Eumeta japonica]